jgi:nucleoside-diphosphate-sugar epimerase
MIDNYVTGASGFIGRHLIKRIKGVGVPLSFRRGDKMDECDKLFFLSTYGNMAYHTDNYMMVRANVMDLLSVISRPHNWICYMSSSSVTLPVQTPYSRTKRAAEEILQGLPGVKSCIVRPYSVTGVGEQKEHLIPTLVRSCMEGEEIPFDPDPVHDFVDVEDVVDGLINLSEVQATGIHEFGWGVAVTNEAVLRAVEFFCERKANIRNVQGLRSYDNPEWKCNNRSEYFQPRKPLTQSIEEIVEAYKRDKV